MDLFSEFAERVLIRSSHDFSQSVWNFEEWNFTLPSLIGVKTASIDVATA